MFFGQRWTVVVALAAVGVALWCEPLWAQAAFSAAAPAESPSGMKVQAGTALLVPQGAPTVMRSGSPTPSAMPASPDGRPGDPSKPGNADKPNGKKPDAEGKGDKKDEKKDDGKGEKKADEEKDAKKDNGPTKRPTEPPEPPDPEVLKARPDEAGKVSFNFKGHSWPSVLEWIADISKMSLDWQELPEGYLNLITQKKYDVAEARDLINRHLLARGYTMLIQDEVISVFKVESINSGMVPRVAPEELTNREPHEFVKVSFQLDWLLAPDAVEELKPMVSPNGKLTALKATNRIEAMDAVLNLQQIWEVLQEEQSDTGQDQLVREFVLKHTSAAEVVEHLNKLLGIESKSAQKGPMTPQQMEAMKRQAQMQAQAAKNAGKNAAPPKPKAEIHLLANERKNSVIVNAPPDKMAVISQAVEILDVSSIPDESIIENIERIQVYRLENIEPDAVIQMIEEMGSLDHRTRLEADKENNAIIASATLVDHVTIRTLVERLDRGGRQSVIVPLEDLRAEMVVKQIDFLMGGAAEKETTESSGNNRGFNPFDPFGRSSSPPRSSRPKAHEDKFRVSADVKNNALLLWCNEFELRKVEGLLEQLEAMPESDNGIFEVRVYRLNTLDPGPLVVTLEDMDALGVHASLEADKESKSIVAYATEVGHKKIQDLIDRLDSSGRKFEVVQLRRLQADYVAGTIEFMMDAGEEEDQSSYSRYFYYRGRSNEKEEKSGFKIDADVESNRLLLLANEAEMKEVMNLLVKLGEIPSDEGDPSKIRIIDSMPGEELEKLLKRIEKAWPSVAPNPLLLPDKDKDVQDKAAQPTDSKRPAQSSRAAAPSAGPPVWFAQLETTDETSAAKPPVAGANPSDTEALPDPLKADHTEDKSIAGKAPVSITIGPDGRLVIASDDTQALDRLEQLLSTLAPRRPDYEIFRLRYAYASTVSLTLEEIFEEKEKDDSSRGRSYFYYDYYGGGGNNDKDDKVRLSKRRPLKFVWDSGSNSILVQNADPDQLRLIGELIEFYDQPEPPDSQSVRKQEIVRVKYSKASVIAETVKDVYRDLLSANDKALANNKEKSSPERSYTYVYDSSGSDEERKAPSFKGLLSLGVDDLSNTLIVSAPAYFITDVLEVIENLDQAAEPTTETVEVISLGEGVSALELQKTLMKLLQQRSAGEQGESGKPPEQKKPGNGSGGPGPR